MAARNSDAQTGRYSLRSLANCRWNVLETERGDEFGRRVAGPKGDRVVAECQAHTAGGGPDEGVGSEHRRSLRRPPDPLLDG